MINNMNHLGYPICSQVAMLCPSSIIGLHLAGRRGDLSFELDMHVGGMYAYFHTSQIFFFFFFLRGWGPHIGMYAYFPGVFFLGGGGGGPPSRNVCILPRFFFFCRGVPPSSKKLTNSPIWHSSLLFRPKLVLHKLICPRRFEKDNTVFHELWQNLIWA